MAADKSAADDGPGSVERPFKTISAGVGNLRPGDVLTVRAAPTRERCRSLPAAQRRTPLLIQAAPGETVVISGADLVHGWVKNPGRKTSNLEEISVAWPGKNLSAIPARRGEGPQMIVDNAVLPLAETLDQLHPGSFTFDPAGAGTIYLWMNRPPRNCGGTDFRLRNALNGGTIRFNFASD